MASQKEIELILKARLDQGDSLSQAQSMAKSMSDALEGAFEGVGSRIVEKILREMNGSLKGLNLSPNTNESGSSYQHQNFTPLSNIDNGNIFQSRNTSSHGSKNYVQQAISSEDWGYVGAGINRPRFNIPKSGNINDLGFNRTNDYMDDSHQMVSNLYKSLDAKSRGNLSAVKGIGDDAARISGVSERHAYEADANIGRLQAYQMAKDLGGNVNRADFLSDEQLNNTRGKLGDIAAGSAQTYKTLTNTIETLTAQLRDNTVALKATEKEEALLKSKNIDPTQENIRAVRNSELEKAKEDRNIAKNAGQAAKTAKDALDREIDPIAGQGNFLTKHKKGIAAATAIAGAAMIGLNEFSNVDTYQARSAAGSASLQKEGLRDTLNRDYGSMMATEMLGGQDYLTGRSSMNVGMRTAGSIGSGLLNIAGGVATGIAGATLGGPIGLGAVAPIAAKYLGDGISEISSAFQGINNFDGMTAQENRKMKDLWKDQHKEFVDMAGLGMKRATMAFQTSQALGDVNYTPWLYGNRDGMNQAGEDAGLDPNEVFKMKAQHAGSTDHIFGNTNLATYGGKGNAFQKSMGRMMVLEGHGLGATSDVASAFYNAGGGNRGTLQSRSDANVGAMNDASQLISDLKAQYRLTGQQTNQLGLNTAGMANQIGLGGQNIAEDYARRVAGTMQATGAHGSGSSEAIASAVQKLLLKGPSPETSHKDVARYQTIQKWEEEFGRDISESQEVLMSGSIMDENMFIDAAGGIDSLKKDKGYLAARAKKGDGYTAEQYAKDRTNQAREGEISSVRDWLGETRIALASADPNKAYTANKLTNDINSGKIKPTDGKNLTPEQQVEVDKLLKPNEEGGQAAKAARGGIAMSAAEVEASFKAVAGLLPTFKENIDLVAASLNKAITEALKPEHIEASAAAITKLSEAIGVLRGAGMDAGTLSQIDNKKKIEMANQIQKQKQNKTLGLAPGGGKQ